jgi:hypothetical protein
MEFALAINARATSFGSVGADVGVDGFAGWVTADVGGVGLSGEGVAWSEATQQVPVKIEISAKRAEWRRKDGEDTWRENEG